MDTEKTANPIEDVIPKTNPIKDASEVLPTAMIPIPIDKDQDLYSLEPLYNIGMEATKNWYRKSFAESNIKRTFDGFLVAEAEHMDRWLMKPENQTALKQAIHEYFTLTNNKCLKYNGNREWSTVPY